MIHLYLCGFNNAEVAYKSHSKKMQQIDSKLMAEKALVKHKD
jgi:hypothetical protein